MCPSITSERLLTFHFHENKKRDIESTSNSKHQPLTIKWNAVKTRSKCLVNYKKQRGRYNKDKNRTAEEDHEDSISFKEFPTRPMETRGFKILDLNRGVFDLYKNELKKSIRRVKSYLKIYKINNANAQ